MLDYRNNEGCPQCGGSDSVGVYVDSNSQRLFKYCYKCEEKISGVSDDKRSKKSACSWPIKGFAHNAIIERRLSKDTALKYDVVSNGDIVVFPLYVNGRVIGSKTRDFNFPKSNKSCHMSISGHYSGHLWGWQSVHTKNIVGIALGEFDAMSITEVTGIPCLSPTNGDGSLLKCIKGDFRRLMKFEKIVFVEDKANGKETKTPHEYVEEAVELLGKDKCYIAQPSLSDPNAYLMQGKGNLLKQLFYSASSATQNLFYESSIDLIKPVEMGRFSGVLPFDKLVGGIRLKETTYVIGAPGKGKTTFVQNLIWSLSTKGFKVCIAALETGAHDFVTGLSNVFYGGNIDIASDVEREEVGKKIDSSCIVSKLSIRNTARDLESTLAAASKIHGCNVAVVDNITTAANPHRQSESVAEYAQLLDCIARDYNLHIFVVSHVGRQAYNGQPDLTASSSSSFVEKMAHNMLSLSREDNDDETKFSLIKNRKKGVLGKFYGRYEKKTSRFEFYEESGVGLERSRAENSRQFPFPDQNSFFN